MDCLLRFIGDDENNKKVRFSTKKSDQDKFLEDMEDSENEDEPFQREGEGFVMVEGNFYLFIKELNIIIYRAS